MFQTRREKLVSRMQQHMDIAILVPGPNMHYFTGLHLKQSERLTFAVITANNDLYFILPQVELNKVDLSNGGVILSYSDEEGPTLAIQRLKKEMGTLQTIGVEFDTMRVHEQKSIEMLTYENLSDIGESIRELRMKKDLQELAYMRQAVQIVEESLAATLPTIQVGVTEMEVAAQLEYEMRRRGSEGTPFGTIVASGYRGALPHGRASTKKIEAGEFIVIDFGAIYKGYVADMTRTVALGDVSPTLQNIYSLVKQANEAAIEAIKPGTTAQSLDCIAREIIRDGGYGDYFTHRLGHGIGLSAHEEPYLMQRNSLVLEEGMAFTVEPGIYIQDVAGVRIEDNLIVTNNGYENLMTFSKELIIL
ncbi:M24 family metallopeptidase [Lysinibacillus fusiformis]|uniref:Creatinase/Prolidase N-terminal domain-containing protein n=1 Tax=Lysinibacillus fusiformis TaxID=28031 RepID=A0A1H9SCZ6_9BACI|nr:aminopeptidase P family protein [Lysinibacillus fusiformis]NOG26784.1 aminopeptidase P family protein [Lysinibacillus fusiformis]SCY83362.1 Creatinase/Prolidase N-terminal domain-containing protein [Lysinibacillus fusiformis]SEO56068.1 Creatinase/Prolidase N-terminal domain-containing protein [Lysinibacillus fusiformis]SER82069.1 Creatinase/Prolidase N-terminal domain-containing protein [Lysinibacillus fusiformis]